MNKHQLLDYGFQESKAKELIKKKKISTMHGEYTLTGGVLKLNGVIKGV